jgi:hypothetical protein
MEGGAEMRTKIEVSDESAKDGTLAKATIQVLERMAEFDRAMFFSELEKRFCMHCGSTEGRRCYCQSDDL